MNIEKLKKENFKINVRVINSASKNFDKIGLMYVLK